MNTKLNRSDIVLLLMYFFVHINLGIGDYYQRDALLIEYLVDFSTEIVITLALLYAFVFWLIPNYIVNKKKYYHFVIFGLLTMFFIGIIHYTIGFWTGENDWTKYPSGYYLLLKGLGHSADKMSFLFGLMLTKKFYESQNVLVDVQKQQKENELKLLRSQLNPHFLFNNLNTLDALIDSSPEKAKEYINRLSLIYRYLIQTKDSEVMELSDEIDFAENYIFLIQTRFGDDYHFDIRIDESIIDKFIPTGAIQALLENVVKHNKVLGGQKVTISLVVEDDWLMITNTKTNQTQNKETLGTGLANLRSRYRLLTDKEMHIEDTSNKFRIRIPIINLAK